MEIDGSCLRDAARWVGELVDLGFYIGSTEAMSG